MFIILLTHTGWSNICSSWPLSVGKEVVATWRPKLQFVWYFICTHNYYFVFFSCVYLSLTLFALFLFAFSQFLFILFVYNNLNSVTEKYL